MPDLVIVRHGESVWNRDGRFSGWADIDLTAQGEAEARSAARALKAEGWQFDLAITSMLKRTIRSQWIILDELDQQWVPLVADWRLNERHYGALSGLSKSEMEAKFGAEQVKLWRRSFDVRPPEMSKNDPRAPWTDRRYAGVPRSDLPLTESLKDTIIRVTALWQSVIAPALTAGSKVILNGHGNSIRALLKRLNGISDDEITKLEIPNSVPIILSFDGQLNVTEQRDLAVEHPAQSFIF